MVSIIRKEIQLLLKDRGTFFWLIILPIAFIVLFSSIYGSTENNNITIHYVDEDQTQASQDFIQSLNQVKGYITETDSSLSLDNQKEKIKNGKMSSLLVIPKGFEDDLQAGKQVDIEFYQSSSDTTVSAINALLNNVIAGFKDQKIQGVLSSLGQNDIQIKQIMTSPLQVSQVNMDVKSLSATTQVVPGMMVMFVFFILISMVRGFIKENNSGMLARLRTTSMKPIQYLLGMWISFTITVLIQCTFLLGFGHYVYHLNIGNFISIAAMVIAIAISATGIGLALSFFVKSENQGIAFTQIIVMGGAALGGLWFPFELLPSFIQKIAHFIPQYWAQNGLQNIMVRGVTIQGVALNIMILLLFGIGGIGIALLRFKRYILSAKN